MIQLFTISAILLLLISCSKIKHDVNQCRTDCIEFNNQHVKVKLNTNLVLVEQVYKMLIHSKNPISQANLSGINMNMGRLPLTLKLLEKTDDGYFYETSVILGICSEPEMQWQLTILTNQSTSNFNFTSYWHKPQS